jgi:hypothetical protein
LRSATRNGSARTRRRSISRSPVSRLSVERAAHQGASRQWLLDSSALRHAPWYKAGPRRRRFAQPAGTS